ncbi:uncharacterized protein LOC134221701 [Armigeres subalbatus]|uniref:uncharacterized protein LOC134221701 n=1 Tax=Armigeres subalbatus TaxID=124917 RepID=UPI002ED6BEE7
MESFAIPFDKVAGGKSDLVAAVVKIAQEVKLSAAPSAKEHQLLEAILESLVEWKRRIQVDCQTKAKNPFETADALEQVQQGINLCLLKLHTINELLPSNAAINWPEKAPESGKVQTVKQLLYIAEIRQDNPGTAPSKGKTVPVFATDEAFGVCRRAAVMFQLFSSPS